MFKDEGTFEEALAYALHAYPDSPGVARLCQELLSYITGEPITTPTEGYPRFVRPNYMARHVCRRTTIVVKQIPS